MPKKIDTDETSEELTTLTEGSEETEEKPKPAAKAASKNRGKAEGSVPKPELSFEQALAQLEALVQKLERGEISLEESMLAYEEGVKLTALCSNRLKNAKLKIEELRNTPNEE